MLEIQFMILGLSRVTSCIANTSKIDLIISHILSTFDISNSCSAVNKFLGGKPFYPMTEMAISKLLRHGCLVRDSRESPLKSRAG